MRCRVRAGLQQCAETGQVSYDYRVRFSLVCAVLVACDGPEAHPPDAAYPAPVAPPSTAASGVISAAPESPPAPQQAGPFYEPEPDGKPTAILRTDAPNMRYAALDRAQCEAELKTRAVPFVAGEATSGVMDPVRISGPLHGVSIHSALATSERDHSPSTIFDCRLVLAVDDFAAFAATKGIVEMVYFGAYRPQSAYGCTAKYAGQQHCAGLAVDVGTFKKADGTVLSVEKDFHGKVGNPTCGPTARRTTITPSSTELWSLVCDTADRAIFNVMLTPNYNAQHFNHVHLEITPDAAWMLIH